MPRPPKPTNPDAGLDIEQLFSKSLAQFEALITQMQSLAVSDKQPDPSWFGIDTDVPVPLIDTDPPTDVIGQARNTVRTLRRYYKAEVRKSSRYHVKYTGCDDAIVILSLARRAISKIYRDLQEAHQSLIGEQARLEVHRQEFASRQADILARKLAAQEVRDRQRDAGSSNLPLKSTPSPKSACVSITDPIDQSIIDILRQGDMHIDEISYSVDLPISDISARAIMLEFSGHIRNIGSMTYQLVT